LPCFMLDICELTSFVIRSELMWFHDSIFSEHAFSSTAQMENLGTNVTVVLNRADELWSTNHEVVCSFRPTQHRQCARFRTTFEFEHEYLWKKLRYRQAVNGVFNHYLCHVKCKNRSTWVYKSQSCIGSFRPTHH